MADAWIRALEAVAGRWTDPDHPPRAEAAERTLAADNPFTEASVAFDVNVAAALVAEGRLAAWVRSAGVRGEGAEARVAVLSGGRTPTEGLLEAAAAAVAGHAVLLEGPDASPALAQAFFDEVAEEAGQARVRVVARPAVLVGADAVLGLANPDEQIAWSRAAERAGIAPERRLWMPAGWGVGVLDGRESRAELSGLAEDALLHEGATPRSVRLLWAPADLEPDPLLDTLAAFRATYPPHPRTEGRLRMPAAFLEATRQPMALGPGFLVSKGDPAPQPGAHLRWVPYVDLDDVTAWLRVQAPVGGFVATRPALAERMRAAGLPVLGFGDAHRLEPGRPPLDAELLAFLRRLAV